MTSWSRTFPGRPEQIAHARQFVTAVLAGRPEAECAALVASELCTNAVCHSASGQAGGLFTVTVRREPDQATITVQDMGSDAAPAMAGLGGGEPEESGRGLLLVAAVAKQWGAARTPAGWRVWADLASVGDGPGG